MKPACFTLLYSTGGDPVARHYQSPEAMCPFYRMEERTAIHCEGVSPGATLTLQWKSSADQYRQQYCYGDWTRCKIARALWEGYDDPGYLRCMKCETQNRIGVRGSTREKNLYEEFIQQIKNRP